MTTKKDREMIGKKIRDARKQKNFIHQGKWTIDAVAKKAKISKSYLCQIEHGDRYPSPKIAKKLQDILDIQLTCELCGGVL